MKRNLAVFLSLMFVFTCAVAPIHSATEIPENNPPLTDITDEDVPL